MWEPVLLFSESLKRLNVCEALGSLHRRWTDAYFSFGFLDWTWWSCSLVFSVKVISGSVLVDTVCSVCVLPSTCAMWFVVLTVILILFACKGSNKPQASHGACVCVCVRARQLWVHTCASRALVCVGALVDLTLCWLLWHMTVFS